MWPSISIHTVRYICVICEFALFFSLLLAAAWQRGPLQPGVTAPAAGPAAGPAATYPKRQEQSAAVNTVGIDSVPRSGLLWIGQPSPDEVETWTTAPAPGLGRLQTPTSTHQSRTVTSPPLISYQQPICCRGVSLSPSTIGWCVSRS